MRRLPRTIALGLGIIALLAACSSSGGGAAASPSAAGTSEPSAAGPATIELADNDLGQIIVDGEGKVLYLFEKDTDGESACYDDCEAAWPPLLVTDEPVAGEGLDASKLTTVDRTDGTKQVKYGDWPLYYFAADAAAGETKGQAVGDVWWVVDASGAAIK